MFGARLPTNPSHYGDAKCSCARCNVFGARLRTRPSHYGMYVCMYVYLSDMDIYTNYTIVMKMIIYG